jgi:BASS family bile acid:Na+ symporter
VLIESVENTLEIELVHIVTATLISIAFGMGLGLELADFRNILLAPKGVFVGMFGQLVALPVIAIILATFAGSPVVAAGLILVGVCPGGSSSNYFTYLAKGDVALSVSLTAVSGMLSVVSVPFFFNLASGMVLDSRMSVSLPVLDTMSRIFLYLIVPVIIGMTLRKLFTDIAERAKDWVANLAFVVLVALTPVLIAEHLSLLAGGVAHIFLLGALLIISTMGTGFGLGKLFGLNHPQTRSVTVEVGVQNVALAIVLALTFFEDSSYALVPVIYLLLMYIFVPAFVFYCRKNTSADTAQ